LKKSIGRILFTLAVVGMAARSDASVLTIPPGLNGGDTYRLVFVTSTTTNATSNNIGYYNTFVTNVADAVPELFDLGATWTVIGSTDSVSAVTNIGTTTSGIYTLDGNEVASSTAALFNTGATDLLSPIDIDPQGNTTAFTLRVWTGSTSTGGPTNLASLGCCIDSAIGIAGITNHAYLAGDFANNNTTYSLYAISSEITVAPEPNTIGLAALGGAILLLAQRRKQPNHIATRTDRTPLS
jgi:hypothetical protein